MRQVVYSIEGNIGSGKTVLLNLLAKRMTNIAVAPEPVADWQQVNQHNLLQQYYSDPQRWAYTFQNYAILTRSKHLHQLLQTEYPAGCLLFSERSIGADREIFAKLLHRQKKMTDMEHSLYVKFYDDLSSLYKLPPVHRHIYLRTDPQRCQERIRLRNRAEEQSIPLDYLQSLHQMHEEWLVGSSNLIIDGTIEFETDPKQLQRIIENISSWLREHKYDVI